MMLREDYITFDRQAFELFVATRPSLSELQVRFPTVHVVLPNEIVTHDFKPGGNRFFPLLEGTTVLGGSFR